MSETKWTPGPWSIECFRTFIENVVRILYEISPDQKHDDFCIAIVRPECGGNDSEVEANAFLIHAAPDMADALHQWKVAEETGDAVELEAARKSRDAALAKARGES